MQYPGILILDTNKTYGRTANKKRLLYKCILDFSNENEPVYVPYDIPMGFHKKFTNKYVLVTKGSPHGQIAETIGDVDHYESYAKYRMYCRNLWTSLSRLSKILHSVLQNNNVNNDETSIIQGIFQNPRYFVKDFSNFPLFTIDPKGCLDIDDGFSLEYTNDTTTVFHIHIANPSLVLDHLYPNIWNDLTERTTTIYLPHKKEPMLPKQISEDLCSLKQGAFRITLSLIVTLDGHGNVLDTQFHSGMVRVEQNYDYDDMDIPPCASFSKTTCYQHYQIIKTITEKRCQKTLDSHEVVEHWMVFMNHECGKWLANKQQGIFRVSHVVSENHASRRLDLENICDHEVKRAVSEWASISGKYTSWDNGNEQLDHVAMGISHYVHITSPIRRMVDLVNQILLLKHCTNHNGMTHSWSEQCIYFVNKYICSEGIEKINKQNKQARKIQQECEDMRWAMQTENLNQSYTGIVLDILQDENKAVVYLKSLKRRIYVKIKDHGDLLQYAHYEFCAYYFEKEGKLQKKIKWTYL